MVVVVAVAAVVAAVVVAAAVGTAGKTDFLYSLGPLTLASAASSFQA